MPGESLGIIYNIYIVKCVFNICSIFKTVIKPNKYKLLSVFKNNNIVFKV